mgnify:CR=1 FL=1
MEVFVDIAGVKAESVFAGFVTNSLIELVTSILVGVSVLVNFSSDVANIEIDTEPSEMSTKIIKIFFNMIE